MTGKTNPQQRKFETCLHSRENEVLPARVRSGHFRSLKAYIYHLNATSDQTCLARQLAEHALYHWLVDSQVIRAIRWVFGCTQESLK